MLEFNVVLARQRRDYGLSTESPAQYPIEQQTANIDDTPVTNKTMERLCDRVNHRLHKLKALKL